MLVPGPRRHEMCTALPQNGRNPCKKRLRYIGEKAKQNSARNNAKNNNNNVSSFYAIVAIEHGFSMH